MEELPLRNRGLLKALERRRIPVQIFLPLRSDITSWPYLTVRHLFCNIFPDREIEVSSMGAFIWKTRVYLAPSNSPTLNLKTSLIKNERRVAEK